MADIPSFQVRLTQQQMEKARETFSKYDQDKDGQIPFQELREVLYNLLETLCPEHECEAKATELMDIIDADGDGTITYMEFLKGYDRWAEVEAAHETKVEMEQQISALKRQLYQTKAAKEQKEAKRANIQIEVTNAKVLEYPDSSSSCSSKRVTIFRWRIPQQILTKSTISNVALFGKSIVWILLHPLVILRSNSIRQKVLPKKESPWRRRS